MRWMLGESSFGLNYLEIPDGCSILSAIYILRGMYMKCHFYVHRHLNLLGMFCHLMQLFGNSEQLFFHPTLPLDCPAL